MAAYRVGVEIGVNRAGMCVVDGQGSILCRRVFGATSVDNAERFTDTLCDHLEDLLLKRGLQPGDVKHIGIAVAGGALLAHGERICAPEVFGGQAVALRSLVEGRVGVNPTVLGDARAAALAELWAGHDAVDFLCLTLSRKVGVALVRGGQPAAIEPAAACGATGDAGEDALPVEMADALTRALGSHVVAELAHKRFPHKLPVEKVAARDVIALAQDGDAEAAALLAERVAAFADAVMPLCARYGVQTVVLAGSLCTHQQALIDPLNVQLAALAQAGSMGGAPVARQATYGGDAVMVGAALGMDAVRA